MQVYSPFFGWKNSVWNVADLRPLFEWMPVLFIFLIATLTMKMWSEERRMGTEFLLTFTCQGERNCSREISSLYESRCYCARPRLGLAGTVVAGLEILIGPLLGAYLASLLLASAYTSIGLYVSSKTESQIVSLILTVLVCGLFYIVGSDLVVGFLVTKAVRFSRALAVEPGSVQFLEGFLISETYITT